MKSLSIKDAYPRYSYDDYVNWEGRWELIDGIVYAMSPMPLIEHQSISGNIYEQLREILKECSMCKALLSVDWKIGNETIVQPDNLVICHKPRNEAYLTKAPVIIFEVLSKSTAKKDTTVKFKLYQFEGVKYYIIVDPDEKIAKVFELKDGRYIKVGDFEDEKATFKLEKCKKELEFNFGRIWD